jgi:hypothetical protein
MEPRSFGTTMNLGQWLILSRSPTSESSRWLMLACWPIWKGRIRLPQLRARRQPRSDLGPTERPEQLAWRQGEKLSKGCGRPASYCGHQRDAVFGLQCRTGDDLSCRSGRVHWRATLVDAGHANDGCWCSGWRRAPTKASEIPPLTHCVTSYGFPADGCVSKWPSLDPLPTSWPMPILNSSGGRIGGCLGELVHSTLIGQLRTRQRGVH